MKNVILNDSRKELLTPQNMFKTDFRNEIQTNTAAWCCLNKHGTTNRTRAVTIHSTINIINNTNNTNTHNSINPNKKINETETIA